MIHVNNGLSQIFLLLESQFSTEHSTLRSNSYQSGPFCWLMCRHGHISSEKAWDWSHADMRTIQALDTTSLDIDINPLLTPICSCSDTLHIKVMMARMLYSTSSLATVSLKSHTHMSLSIHTCCIIIVCWYLLGRDTAMVKSDHTPLHAVNGVLYEHA